MSQELALDAVATVSVLNDSSRVEVDIKNYARIEKIAGGQIEESKVLKGALCEISFSKGAMAAAIRWFFQGEGVGATPSLEESLHTVGVCVSEVVATIHCAT